MSRFTSQSPKPPHSLRSSDSAAVVQAPHTTLPQRLLSPIPSAPLPPIFASPDGQSPDAAALDEQIYLFIALSLRAFVLPWWSKLSPRDKEFLPQITIVARHVLKQVHQRILHADLVGLITIDVPSLVRQHYADYRHAQAKLGTSFANLPVVSIDGMFHTLQPHLALKDDGSVDPMYLRTAIDLIIKASLPYEDSSSDLERTILREVLVGPVLGEALPKLAQPWFIHQTLLNLLGPPRSGKEQPAEPKSSPLSINSLIIVFLTTIQTISTLCLNLIHLSQQLYRLAQVVNSKAPSKQPKSGSQKANPFRQGLVNPWLRTIREVLDLNEPDNSASLMGGAALSTIQLWGGLAEPFLDNVIPYLLQTHVLTAGEATKIVTTSIRTLFPESNNHYPGPPPIVPSQEEQLVLKETLLARIKEVLPYPFNNPATANAILEPLSSAQCNMHLVILIFDLLVVALFPELGLGEMAAEVSFSSSGGSPYPDADEND